MKYLMLSATMILIAACAGESQISTDGTDDGVGIPAGETGGMCGGIAGISCLNEDDFCQMDTGVCLMPDASGVCVTKPEICTDEYDPVCGCDGNTYGNSCEAAAAGMNIVSDGECEAQN